MHATNYLLKVVACSTSRRIYYVYYTVCLMWYILELYNRLCAM